MKAILLIAGSLFFTELTIAQFVRNNIEYNLNSYSLDEDSVDLSSPYFEVHRFGWINVSLIKEEFEGYYYPDTSVYHEPGRYGLYSDMAHYGDFNGDGYEDIAMQWVVFPHTLERESLIPIDLFINDGQNGFDLFSDYTNDQHLNHMPYRMRVGKFNDDEYDDAVTASMGVITRLPDGTYTDKWEPFQVLVSNGDGTYRDATREVEGQEKGNPISTFAFAHDLSVGDINGDGFDDVYQGKHLFYSNGDGSFRNESDELPAEIRYDAYARGYVMSSEIADLNNDGFGDLIAMYSDCSDCENTPSGYVAISQKRSGSMADRRVIEIPVGRYGKANTKFNYVIAYDVNLDGWLDIVTAVTRGNPYYVGSHLQIFVNQEGQGFIDQTEDFITFPEDADTIHGEGVMYVRDVNSDGIQDIIHSLSSLGFRVYLHDGEKLKIVDHTWFPHVYGYHLTEQPWFQKPEGEMIPNFHSKAFPVDIDGIGTLDYISSTATGIDDDGFVKSYHTFYSVIGKKPLRTATPTAQMEFLDGVPGDTTLEGNYFRIGWNEVEGVDAVTIQWSTDYAFSMVDSMIVMDTSIVYLKGLDINTRYYWRLKGWNNMGSTDWTEPRSFTTGTLTSLETSELPGTFSLYQNYPNPFNPSTTIKFALPQTSEVRLEVFNLLGQSVGVLIDGVKQAGSHSVNFNASGLSTGVYFYRLDAPGFSLTRQMLLIK